jgi:hypothetical protein
MPEGFEARIRPMAAFLNYTPWAPADGAAGAQDTTDLQAYVSVEAAVPCGPDERLRQPERELT